MTLPARFLVRRLKNGQYAIVPMPPAWANREVAGFASEAAARLWIARQPPL